MSSGYVMRSLVQGLVSYGVGLEQNPFFFFFVVVDNIGEMATGRSGPVCHHYPCVAG